MPSENQIAAAVVVAEDPAHNQKKMPLVTLDPNKPKLLVGGMMVRSPTKRSTPPQSPPTPHKIELIEDETYRTLRSSLSNGGTSSSSSSSSSSSTSSEEGLRLLRTSSKKKLFQNGTSPSKAVRTSPRKADEKATVALAASTTNGTAIKGPKKK
jgi:hypothetical protein